MTTFVLSALILNLILPFPPESYPPDRGGSQSATRPGKQEAADKALRRLHEILRQIEESLKSYVPPEKLESRLKGRTPVYRQVRLQGKPEPPPPEEKGDPLRPEEEGAETKPPENRIRLFGDKEKDRLPPGTVMLVEGIPVSEDEIQELADFYAGYLDETGKAVKGRAMLEIIKVKTAQSRFKADLPELEKKIARIREMVTTGKMDFAEAAKAHSEAPSAPQGGDLGMFGRDSMVGPFARWAFKLPPGKISPVFASPFGYHVLKVTGRQKGDRPSMDRVRASHILVLFTKDEGLLHRIMTDAAGGRSRVAVLNDEWRDLIPPPYVR